jgi:glyoxylase-like metal-dependent hydrolase (beta-lactamase superfamily II)
MSERGPFPISNLHRLVLPTPFPCGPINVYLAAGAGDQLTLVDTGPRTSRTWDALVHALAGHGYAVADIQRVIVTHAHVDHFGLAARIVATSGAQVLALASNRPRLEDYTAQHQRRAAFYEAVLRRGGAPAEVVDGTVNMVIGMLAQYGEAVPITGLLADGDVLRVADVDWTVLHTPGHAIGHMCLYQPDARLLLSGDHLIRHISSNPVIEPPAQGASERPRSLVLYLRSLQRVADLDVDLALPGHGEPITDHRALIAERLQHHETRMDRILAALDSRSRTAYEITRAIFPNPSPLDVFLGLSEVIGHLDILAARGQVVEEGAGTPVRYRRK